MRMIVTALVGALAAPGVAFAQSAGRGDEEVIVTAPIEGARIESLQGAAVLRREDIIESLNGGLGDTLDAQPGVSTTFFGAGASRPIIRGLGEDRVRVLENGIGAIDASTASPDHAVTADGLDAERIEVLRGAAALAYGGNAIGGVVNVIDQSIPTRVIEELEGEALASYSSVDDGKQLAADIGAGAGSLAFRVSAASRDTENYEIPGFAESEYAHEGEEEEEGHEEAYGVAPNSWTEFRTYAAGGSFVDDWGFVGLAVKRTQSAYGLPGHEHHAEEGEEEEGPEIEPRIEMEQTRVELRGDVRVDWGVFDRLDFAAQHADYEHTEFEEGGEPGTRFISEGFEGRVELHHHAGAHDGVSGLQFTDVDFAAEGEEAFITPTNTRDIGVFFVERWDQGGWGLEGGARGEQREVDNAIGGARDFESFSGSLGAFVRPAQNWFLGATIARTERAPTAIELFAEGPHLATASYEIGDAALDKEAALSFEASARYDTDPFRFELNLFRVDFSDYIALVERGDVWWLDEETETSGFAPSEDDDSIPEGAEVLPAFNFVQQDAAFTGGEISLRARLFEAAGFRVSGDAAVDIVKAEFEGGGHPPRIPPRSTTIGLEAENDHVTGRIEVVDVAEQDELAAFEAPTDGYTFVNAGLAYRPIIGERSVTIRFDARNLTDEEGRVHSSFLKDVLPLPGRNFRVTLSADF